MEEITIETWDAFVEHANCLDGWAFRGQQQAEWALWSSLSRQLKRFVPDPGVWSEREARAIRIFRRKAHNFVSDPQLLDEDIRCLALMQHHGAPTRLLDFTKSPYVAAFFALQQASDDCAVYALDTPFLWYAAPKHNRKLKRDAVDPRESGNFEKYFLPNKHPIVWTGEPGKLDKRLLAQSGTFVVPGQLNRSVDSIITEQFSDKQSILKKFILKSGMRRTAMESLYRMNLTYATLFPDLEGLARSSAFELEVIWKGVVAYPKEDG